ncbi:MAG TPA: URC4/urg3 family protein, partial [Mycobacterium sp.]|nr:URC4/urg3 family protein [Mycobacterium sp.]
RERAGQLLRRARAGQSAWFTVHDAALAGAADTVADLTRERFPDLVIPYHSRWRHFEAGGVDRRAELEARLADETQTARARAMIDLTVVSVLLDAGAGPHWRYRENATGQWFSRSEGLGVASWHAFGAGLFSSDPDRPLQVDAAGLSALAAGDLATAFQVSPDNPLIGVDGRVALLHRLGEAMTRHPRVFGPQLRPGALYDALAPGPVRVHDILSLLLASLSGIWLADNMIRDQPLGDCWQHPSVAGPGLTDTWMPFHKLSQWLTYSLLEPFAWTGVRVVDLDTLTALPEYRNGGLLLDTGVLRLREPALAQREWTVGDELIVEWRALTVALLDELAPLVRARLGVDEAAMPLACVLEGGTWAAGRALAAQLRDGQPPLRIVSDGTVF